MTKKKERLFCSKGHEFALHGEMINERRRCRECKRLGLYDRAKEQCGNGHDLVVHGFQSGGQKRCRVCHREHAARLRERQREAQAKVCGCCKRRLPVDHTGPLHCSDRCAERLRARGRATAKRQRAANPEKLKQATSAWKAKNRDAVRETLKEWKAANAEHVAEYQRQWQQANPERVRELARSNYARHKEQLKKRVMQWRRKHPEQVRVWRDDRRARRLNADGSYSLYEWLARCDQFKHTCFYCGTAGSLTADHVVALVNDGTNFIDNIVPACASCNSSKSSADAQKWIARRLREGLALTEYAQALLASRAVPPPTPGVPGPFDRKAAA